MGHFSTVFAIPLLRKVLSTGKNSSEMDVRTFAKIISDLLLATKAEII